MIKLDKINKSYGGKKIFENFNLEIEEGKITAVLGESGIGKTTLLNIIAGNTQFEGAVEGVGEKVSFVFQEDRLIPFMTVNRNLEFVLGKGDYSKQLEKVGLSENKDSYISSLSGGMARRVALLRAFLFDSKFILMDEPFSNLDLSTKYKVMDVFKNLWENDKRTAVIVTHGVEEAVFLAHRIIVLGSGGKIEGDFENLGEPTRRSIIKLFSDGGKL